MSETPREVELRKELEKAANLVNSMLTFHCIKNESFEKKAKEAVKRWWPIITKDMKEVTHGRSRTSTNEDRDS